VPASIALAPDGSGVYVGTLTAVPFADGSAKVIKVGLDGTTTDVWTNLTTVTGLAVGPDGTLYAAEMSTGNLSQPPFLVPGSGKVVKQTGPSTSEDVATGLMFPISLAFGPDGGLYAAVPAIGADQGQGAIVWVGGAAMAASASAPMPSCAPIEQTLSPAATPMATPVA
jgi:sugar lactone lactonase YvrE